MRKLAFYPKLALGNLWRNRSSYLPYLLACTVSIFTFYTMLAINTNGALNGLRGEGIVKSFTAIGTVILAVFCSILLFYTNSFLIKRRKKELGLYSILGMEKKNIAALMFYETLFAAAISLALGLGLGLLLSQLLFWVLLRMVRFPVMIAMPISPAAIGITAVFFGIVFLLALLFNLRQVQVASPIGLMAGAKQGEKEPKASWLLTIVGVLCLGGGYFIAVYFTSPIEAIMLFLVAVALVIIGTYCLFTSGSIALLKLLRKNKRYYYQPNHFISVSGMIYRMKQNAAGLATICILSCMVLVTVSSTIALNVGADDSLRVQYPYDYRLTFNNAADGDTLLAAAESIAAESGVELAALQDYSMAYFGTERSGSAFSASNNNTGMSALTMVYLLTLQDYNKNEGTALTLNDGEALLLATGGQYSQNSLTLNGIPYSVRHLQQLGKDTAGGRDLGLTLTLVLPDEAAVQAVLQAEYEATGGMQSVRRRISFDIAGSEEGMQRFSEGYNSYISTLSTGDYFNYHSRINGQQDWYASNGGFLFLGIYFGILFMLAAALIIYYKQMSEGYDDAGRYEILQKVGMGEGEVKKSINRQILAVFFLPLLVAVIHVAVAFFPISRAMVVFGVMNIPLLAATGLFTILAYAFVYLLVFCQTARTYFGIVRRQTASG